VAAVGVAAVAAFKMVGRREDEIGAFVVKIFRKKLGGGRG
jgi:hypothetical protein